jgi:dynamin-binding protein
MREVRRPRPNAYENLGWDDAVRDLLTLNIIHPERITPRTKQSRPTTPSPTAVRIGAVNAIMGSLEPSYMVPAETSVLSESTSPARKKLTSNSNSSMRRLMRPPSSESLHSIRSARPSSGHGHYGDLPEVTSSHTHLPLPRRQSVSTPLRKSSSQSRLLESFGRDGREKDKEREEERTCGNTTAKHTIVDSLLPSLPRRSPGARRTRTTDGFHHSQHTPQRHAHPPVPPPPQLTVSSRWYHAPALYVCRVNQECDPPDGVQYYGLPFFKLYLDEV